MSRRQTRSSTQAALLVVITLALALSPRSLTGWVGWFRDPVETVIAPVSGPVATIADRLKGGQDPRSLVAELERAELERRLASVERERLAAVQRLHELEQLVRDLQSAPYPSEQPMRRIHATRVGGSPPSTIEVRAGTRQGVIAGESVAVARGSQQLVGVVTRTGSRVSTVHVITDRRIRPRAFNVVATPDIFEASDDFAALPRFRLEPAGDGSLVGRDVPIDVADQLEIGGVVRLDDPSWSPAAQMYVLGRIVSIESNLSEPLHQRVTVSPLVRDLGQLRSVILNVPIEPGDRAPAREGGER